MSTEHQQPSATSKVDRGKRNRRIPHTEYVPLGETGRKNKLVTHVRFRRPMALFLNAFFGTRRCRIRRTLPRCLSWNYSERKSITKEAGIESMWKSFGKTSLFATILLQTKVPMRSAMEHKYPEVSPSGTRRGNDGSNHNGFIKNAREHSAKMVEKMIPYAWKLIRTISVVFGII